MIIGINHNYSLEKDFNLQVGETKSFNNYQINFESLESKDRKNYKSVVGNFIIIDSKNDIKETLKPEIRIYNQPSITTSEANIKTNFFYDRFITMSNIQNSEFFNIRFQQKPMMIWIWISALLISLGGILSVFRQKD